MSGERPAARHVELLSDHARVLMRGAGGCGSDVVSLEVTTESEAAAVAFECAAWSFVRHRADTVLHLAHALSGDAELLLAHVLTGFQRMLLGRSDVRPEVMQIIQRADRSMAARGSTSREERLLEALRCWHADRLDDALRVLEQVLATHPCCWLTSKLHHALCFMYGQLERSSRVLERILSLNAPPSQGRGIVLGCYAFTLVEAAENTRDGRLDDALLRAADAAAEAALASSPDDVWALHARVHVSRARRERVQTSAFTAFREQGNNFIAHLAWHAAIDALDAGAEHEALALYDQDIVLRLGVDYRDFVNAISLLVRLKLRGASLGSRLERLADAVQSQGFDHGLVFADLHYLLALVASGRVEQAGEAFAALARRWSKRTPDEAQEARAIGLALAKALMAQGAPHDPVCGSAFKRSALMPLGGSHVQRELFGLWLSGHSEGRHR